MNYLKALLMSKTIQGILLTVGGALVKYAETSFPQYAVLINTVAGMLISGGAVHGIHGRIMAAGPIAPSPTSPTGGEATAFDGTGGELPK
jgi:purine-nucleoside phosphorylase